jgi:hypothetical protein
MQEAVPRTRPLQNHLPVATHFTTEAGVWMPQYLHHRTISGLMIRTIMYRRISGSHRIFEEWDWFPQGFPKSRDGNHQETSFARKLGSMIFALIVLT